MKGGMKIARTLCTKAIPPSDGRDEYFFVENVNNSKLLFSIYRNYSLRGNTTLPA
jgi:hypothetical protein